MKHSLGAITFAYPTPVFLVATYDELGNPNVMNAAWGGICCSQPPCIAVSIQPPRHTYAAIMQRNAFTINIPSENQVAEADYFGLVSGRIHNKFAKSGFTAVKSKFIDAPYIQECPVNIELELIQSVEIGTHTQMIGKILDVKINKNCLNGNDAPDILKAAPLLFDPGQRSYYGVGEFIAKAFSIGKRLTESAD